MVDASDLLGFLSTPYKNATPEQIKRAQEHAYALMKQPENEKYTHWSQGARDIVNALVGRGMINDTTQADYTQRQQAGQTQAQTLTDIQNRAQNNSGVQPPAPQASPITTGSTQKLPPQLIEDVIKKNEEEGGPNPTAPTAPQAPQAPIADQLKPTMKLGGPVPPEDAQTEKPNLQQIAQATGIPPAVTHPAGNVHQDNLARMLADPRIPADQKAQIQKMMIEGATPANRETAQGIQQVRPSNPGETSSPGNTTYHPFSVGDFHTIQRLTIKPDGKTVNEVQTPDGGWKSISDIKSIQRDWKEKDVRQVGTAEHETTEYAALHRKLIDSAYSTGGAHDDMTHIRAAQGMMEDPKFIHGTAQEQRTHIRNFVDTVTGNDPGDAAATSTFIKLIAGNTLNDIKSLGDAHTGPVRVGEMNLINKMNAQPDLPMGAMRAVLDLTARSKQRIIDMADLSMKYRKEHGSLDEGFDREVAKFRNEHPLISDTEIKNYNKLFQKPTEGEKPVFNTIPEGKHLGRQFREIQ